MQHFENIYDSGPNGLWVFLLVSVAMGASTAYVAGKAVAESWRPFMQAMFYALLLGLAVRFIHFALYGEVLVSVGNYVIDCAILIIAAATGFRLKRRSQMQHQYDVLTTTTPAATMETSAPRN